MKKALLNDADHLMAHLSIGLKTSITELRNPFPPLLVTAIEEEWRAINRRGLDSLRENEVRQLWAVTQKALLLLSLSRITFALRHPTMNIMQ